MAQYQKTTPRKDETQKRPLSTDDISFLRTLQTELNTQDTMGNRDPRFWVIVQDEEHPTSEDYADTSVIINILNNEHARTMEELCEMLNDYRDGLSAECTDGVCRITLEDDSITVSSIGEAFEFLEENGFDDFEMGYTAIRQETVPDTLFLTHRECEDHLRRYGYNYHEEAHAYAMTADRSPQFERLIDLIQHVDLDSLEKHLNRKDF